jgi:putative acetyltransferase
LIVEMPGIGKILQAQKTTTMIARRYEPTDLPQIMTVYREAIHTLAAPFYTKEQLDAWAPPDQRVDRWEQRLTQVRTIVIEDDGTIAGFASHDLAGHLDLLFVHPRFARRGVATRLCAAVEHELRVAGVSRIFTEASLAARAFFERNGFRVVREESVECRGAYLRRYAMDKEIVPA